MHAEAYDGFGRMLAASGLDVNHPWYILDVGGADVNGSVRDYFPQGIFTGLDIEAAPGVEIVADAATWQLPEDDYGYDVVIATELAEHAEDWAAIVETMAKALDPEGPMLLITTCASDGRPPHGARGEWGVPEGQWYRNVPPGEMREILERHFREVYVEYQANPGDCYAWARGVK